MTYRIPLLAVKNRIFKHIVFLTVFVFSAVASAKVDSPKCKATKWPYAESGNKINVSDFVSLDRDHLFSFLYFELTSPKPKRTPELGKKLIWYLKSGEASIPRAYLLEAWDRLAEWDSESPPIFKLKEVCEQEQKIRNFIRK